MTDFFEAPASPPRTRAEMRARSRAPRETEQQLAARHSRGKRKKTLWVVSGALIICVAASGWLGYRVLSAKSSLEAAQELVDTVQDQAGAADFAGIAQSAELLSSHSAAARAAAHDPVWRAAEFLPVLGKNLTAVREIAEVIDVISQDTISPLATIAGGLSPDSLKPVDGRINFEPIVQLSAAMGPAAAAFHEAAVKGAAIDVSGTLAPVNDAGTKLRTLLGPADALVSDAASVLQVAPDLLGANGPRKYLLVFPNLAEATALGGTAAALSELTIDNGSIEITRQASSSDIRWRDGNPVITPDPNLESIFGPLMYTRLNLSTSRPDFPTSAEIATAFWQQSIGGHVDGVISIDPVALGHVLTATGPVNMSTGDVLTNKNVVSLLLNEAYFRYQGRTLDETNEMTDPFFAEAAQVVFDSVLGPTTDPAKLVSAVVRGIGEHRIMAWSANPETQAVLAESPLSGILPTNNEEASVTGVFFRDMSASKMDYYLRTGVTLESNACSSDSTHFTTTVHLRSDITQEAADELPVYIKSGLWGSEHFRTEVFIYGPPGTTLAKTEVVKQGRLTTFDKTAEDLGRPVASFMVWLAPGQGSTITATFTAEGGEFGPAAVQTTPMLNPTNVTVESPACTTR